MKITPAFILPVLVGIILLYFVDMTSVVMMFLSIAVYTVIYLFSLWRWGMNDEEKRLISGPIKKIKNKCKRKRT